MFTIKSAELFRDYEAEKKRIRNEFQDKKNKNSQDEMVRKLSVFNEEYNVNICEAYRQLGKRGCREQYISREKPFRATIGLGPKNIDAYVFESTKNRTTLDYTNPNTGAKAVIRYQSIKVEVRNSEKFDKVFAYLLPDSLSSFNRMNTSDNVHFELPLNELLRYKLVCVAYRGEEVFYDEIPDVSSKNYQITLIPSTEFRVKTILKSNSELLRNQIMSDQDFYKVEVSFENKNLLYQAQESLNLRIGKYLFPSLDDECFINRNYSQGEIQKY